MLKKRPFLKLLSQNTIYLLIGNLGGTGLAFVFSILIARVLGEVGLGIYSAVLAWIFSFSMLIDFGLSSLLTRDVAANPEKTRDYLRVAIQQRWIFGVLLCLLLIFAADFLSQNAAIAFGLRLSAPLLLIEPLFSLYTAIFRAEQRMLPIAILNIGMLLVQLALVALALWQGLGIEWVLLLNMLTSLGRLIVAWFWYHWTNNAVENFQTESPKIEIMPLLQAAWPFALAALLAVAQQRMGILMLENLGDLQQLGQYAAVSRFIEAGRMIPNAFFGALFPALAGLASNTKALNRFFLRVLLGLAMFGILAGIFGMLFSEILLNFTYGAAFAKASILLQIAIWTLLPSLLRSARTLYYYAQGREAYVNLITGIMLILQFCLSLWLIPILGSLGLILALLIVEIFGLVLLK